MALADNERMDYGFVRDDERRLVVTSEADGHMDQGFLKDQDGRLIITGIESGGGTATAFYDPASETWEPRPDVEGRVTFVSPVHGAPDPGDAVDFDEKIEPRE